MEPFKVALVDDHRLFREGLRALLAAQPDLSVVGEAAEPGEACSLVDASDPDLVVLDVVLANGASGLALVRELLRRLPQRRVLMLSMLLDEQRVAEALEAGA
ncbi:MAG TPA: response regulator transcription factor, partial [Myxococcales bacterium]|nr:response regulator transcription factor [Myxococcales bacterium]